MNKVLKIMFIVLIIFLIVGGVKYIKNYRIHKMLNEEYSAKYNVNDLYKSKELNYRFTLNHEEKEIYEKIIEGFINFDNNIELNLNHFDYTYDSQYLKKTSEIVRKILIDHPELIHVGIATVTTQKGSGNVVLLTNYVMTKEEYRNNIDEILKIIENVRQETKRLNDYEKVKYVYDYLGKNNSYGNKEDPFAQSAYSAFNKELSPVCAGYARASQILFYNIKINSLLISGDAKYALFLGSPHEWNVVEINSKFYLYDVTMSDGYKEEFYSGFLINGKKHSPANKKIYPYLSVWKNGV